MNIYRITFKCIDVLKSKQNQIMLCSKMKPLFTFVKKTMYQN